MQIDEDRLKPVGQSGSHDKDTKSMEITVLAYQLGFMFATIEHGTRRRLTRDSVDFHRS